MFDNEPELVREFLHRKKFGDLDQELMLHAKTGWELYYRLTEKHGLSHLEAYAQALECVVPSNGPEFSDNPPEPVSLEDQDEVIRRLERREEIREMLTLVKKK
jgi:hypothetical protein